MNFSLVKYFFFKPSIFVVLKKLNNSTRLINNRKKSRIFAILYLRKVARPLFGKGDLRLTAILMPDY